MAGRSRNTPDSPSATGPGTEPGGRLPADLAVEELYGTYRTGGLDDETDPDDAPVFVPPVRLLPEAELAEAALRVPLLDRAVRLARWIAPYRPVDQFGEPGTELEAEAAAALGLTDADPDPEHGTAAIMQAWSLAVDLELIEIGEAAEGEDAGEGQVARPGADLEAVESGDPEAVLEAWLSAADVVIDTASEADAPFPDPGELAVGDSDELDEESAAAAVEEFEAAHDEAQELLDQALQVLYESTAFAEQGAETVPLGVLAALLVVPDGQEPTEEMLGDITSVMVSLDPMLSDLAEIGLVEYHPIDPDLFEEPEEEGEAETLLSDAPVDDEEAARFGLVRLTPLGQYGVRQWLLEEGYDAPLVGEHAKGDAARLLRGVSEAVNVLPEEEIREWVRGREPLAAARELLAAARGGDTLGPVRRVLCQLALTELGAGAEPALREVLDDPELGGFCRAWLVERGAADVPEPGRTMALWTTVDTLAAQLLDPDVDTELLTELVGGLPLSPDPAAFLAELWRVDHVCTPEVLDAIGEFHGDKKVAKEARKAAYKARSRRSE
ncbi:hypothetical protein [Peterkaempfera griseoplana]|uniref:hypothetical protein n=1 Tax=Peterkaempfera griseoplana TaxID=66896 RepID=UPI0006E3EDE0|nr:hypothetical protein [Peterkaempfera griseoplana]